MNTEHTPHPTGTDGGLGLNRRRLLGAGAGVLATGAMTAVASPAAALSAGHPGTNRPGGGSKVIPANRIGLQIFTMRSLIGADFSKLEMAFEVISDAGIREIELAGTYYDKSVRELRAVAESFGVRIASNHFGPRSLTAENPWATAAGRRAIFADAKALGFPLVGTGSTFGIIGNDEMTTERFKYMADLFNQWGEHAVREGLAGFFFHNHDREFTLEKGRPVFDTLLKYTDPRYVKFEVDLGWLAISGQDPYAYLRKHQDRFSMFHIKDFAWDPNGNRTAAPGTAAAGRKFRFVDLGKGELDYGHILSALKDLRAHRYFLEHDDAGDLLLNPPGAANTVWRGATGLSQIKNTGRR